MTPYLIAVDWRALLMVAAVTIVASAVIAALMSLSNWFFTPRVGAQVVSTTNKVLGFITLGVIGVFLLFGLYLMIPYFH